MVSLLRLLRPLRPFLALTIGVLVLSPIVPAAQDDETARINAWFEKKFEEQLAFSPIQQTFLGHKSGAIDDMSIAAQDRVVRSSRPISS